MPKFFKTFRAVCVIGLLIAVVSVSSIARTGIDALRDMIQTPGGVISITANGISIADAICIDENGIVIGGTQVDFSDIGSQVADQLDAVGVTVGEHASGNLSSDISESGFVQNRYAFDAAELYALEIDVTGCNVVIAGGDTDRIVVDVLETETLRYSFSSSDKTLAIRDNQSENHTVNILGFEFSLGRKTQRYTGLAMVVYLPADFSGEIAVQTTDSDVKIGNITLDDALTVKTTNGDVELSETSADSISVRTSQGKMTLAKLSATEITAETSEGRVTMSELTAKRLSVSTTHASIDFVRLFGEKFEFSTSSGDIDGSIIGSEGVFSIVTETDRSASPATKENSRAQYSLRAKTNGGDINVRFVE